MTSIKIGFAALILSISVSSCMIKKEDSQESTAQVQPETNELVDLTITTSDGDKINLREQTGKNIFIVFDPECDHCQHEATEINANLDAFMDYSMFWISMASLEDQAYFSERYGLEEPNITFGQAETMWILRTFGNISFPSIYIYNEQRKLVKEFHGQTPVEEIIRYL